jgi:hypothetical protein
MAEFHLLHEGYLSGTDDDFVGSTVSSGTGTICGSPARPTMSSSGRASG